MKINFNNAIEAYDYFLNKANDNELKKIDTKFIYSISVHKELDRQDKIFVDNIVSKYSKLPKAFLNYAILYAARNVDKEPIDVLSLEQKINGFVMFVMHHNLVLKPESIRNNLIKIVDKIGHDKINEMWNNI